MYFFLFSPFSYRHFTWARASYLQRGGKWEWKWISCLRTEDGGHRGGLSLVATCTLAGTPTDERWIMGVYDGGLRCFCTYCLLLLLALIACSYYLLLAPLAVTNIIDSFCTRAFYVCVIVPPRLLGDFLSSSRRLACSPFSGYDSFLRNTAIPRVCILISASVQRQRKRERLQQHRKEKGQKEVGMRFQMNYMTGPIERR